MIAFYHHMKQDTTRVSISHSIKVIIAVFMRFSVVIIKNRLHGELSFHHTIIAAPQVNKFLTFQIT
jgi:hypothetical protein